MTQHQGRLGRIQLAGLRPFSKVDLTPGPLTVLIGPNGAGKSNLLAVLLLVPLIRTQSLRRFVGEAGGASALLHYGPSRTQTISIRLDFAHSSGRNSYGARLGYAAG